MKADTKTETEVRKAIAGLTGNYERRNLAGFMACFAEDPDVTLIGTGVDEKRVGRAQIETQVTRDWEQTDTVAMRFNDPAVSAAGNVAWAATDGTFEIKIGQEEMKLPARATFVLERRDGGWLIVQSHFSSPLAEQEEGQSVPH